MAKQVGKNFVWVIKDFSSLQCEKCYSAPVLIGDCKWRLLAFPKGNNVDYLSLYLEVADFEPLPSGWRRYVKLQLTVVKQVSEKGSAVKATHRWFDQKVLDWGFRHMIPLTKLQNETEGFLVNGELIVAAEVEVLEVIGTSVGSEESQEASEPLSEMKLDDVSKSSDCLNNTQQDIDVNGFQFLSSQVESVRHIFERHPHIAVGFRAKNQHLRNACMSFLLSLIETLCQSLQELSNEDLVEADIALTYVKDAGFKVDWLEKKLDQVKEKKEREQSSLVRLLEMKTRLLELKQKCSDLDAQVEMEEAELSSTRAALSFHDVV